MQREQPIIEADYTELDEVLDPANDQPPSQALVPVAPWRSDRAVPQAGIHPDASFVTHLLAVAANSPQTRGLRRASSEDALASYRRSILRQDNLPRIGKRMLLVA